MTTTISPPVRVFAGLGVIAAAALGLWLFMLARSTDAQTAAPPPPRVESRVVPEAVPGTVGKPAVRPSERAPSGFPSAVDRAFRKHRVVVVAVFMPGAHVDALVRREARAGAVAAGAGFVDVSAANDDVAGRLLAKTGVLPSPAVVVVERPGVVVATLGVVDRETVVQAVAQAKR